MPRITPLSAVRDTLLARGWTHLDALAAEHAQNATAWSEGDGLVTSWTVGPRTIVHAIEEVPFGPTAELLARVLPALPRQFELRVGPAAAGIVAETHHIEMLAPVRRLRRPATDPPARPPGGTPLEESDRVLLSALVDRDAPDALPDLAGGFGWKRDGALVAAMAVHSRSSEVVFARPPRLGRTARRDEAVADWLAGAAAHVGAGKPVTLDLRADRRERRELAIQAGFTHFGGFERWSAKRV